MAFSQKDDDEILTMRELSALLRAHPTTLYRLVKRGEIPGFWIGGEWRFRKDLIESWTAKKRNGADE